MSAIETYCGACAPRRAEVAGCAQLSVPALRASRIGYRVSVCQHQSRRRSWARQRRRCLCTASPRWAARSETPPFTEVRCRSVEAASVRAPRGAQSRGRSRGRGWGWMLNVECTPASLRACVRWRRRAARGHMSARSEVTMSLPRSTWRSGGAGPQSRIISEAGGGCSRSALAAG